MVFISTDEIPDPIEEISQELSHVPVVAGLGTGTIIALLGNTVAAGCDDLITVTEGHLLDGRGFVALFHGIPPFHFEL